VRLRDGRVLLVGNSDAPRGELFDPATESWSLTGPMVEKRFETVLVALPDGGALAIGAGCESLASCERFDPERQTWHPAPALPAPRARHAAVVTGGRVLVIGGMAEYTYHHTPKLRSVFAWSPGDATWTPMADLSRDVSDPQAIVLSDGSVLIGYDGAIDRWEPTTETWSSLGEVQSYATLVALPQGGAAVVGGVEWKAGNSNVVSYDGDATAEVRLWDPDGGWRHGENLPGPRRDPVAIPLGDRRIALIGGLLTKHSWEDTSDGGELDWEYRSFHAYVLRHVDPLEVLIGDPVRGTWARVEAPAIPVPMAWTDPPKFFTQASAVLLEDGRVLVMRPSRYETLLWTPPAPLDSRAAF